MNKSELLTRLRDRLSRPARADEIIRLLRIPRLERTGAKRALRQHLSDGSLVLVRFEGRRILLGVTRGQWTALADLGRGAMPQSQDPLSSIDAELNRALNADRLRRGRKGS